MSDSDRGGPPSVTVPIATGRWARFDPRPALRRVQGSGIAITQIVVAATGAYAFAALVLGHPSPLIAATVTVSSLGLERAARPRRVLDTVIGMLVGILVAEALQLWVGPGVWQLGLALALTLVVARFLSPNPTFAVAAAIQSLIVMAIPADTPFLRLVDGLVGGAAALVVTALIPRNPLAAARRDGHTLFVGVNAALVAVVQGLRYGSRGRAERGLEKARALEPLLEQWRASVETGVAIARISPFLRARRAELERQEHLRRSMDLVVRHLRVIARRAAYQDIAESSRQTAAELLGQIGAALTVVEDSLDDIGNLPAARSALLAIASRLDPAAALPQAPVAHQYLIAQLRPLVVDALVATGMPAAQARAILPAV